MPRVIKRDSELAGLPEGAVLRDEDGAVSELAKGFWFDLFVYWGAGRTGVFPARLPLDAGPLCHQRLPTFRCGKQAFLGHNQEETHLMSNSHGSVLSIDLAEIKSVPSMRAACYDMIHKAGIPALFPTDRAKLIEHIAVLASAANVDFDKALRTRYLDLVELAGREQLDRVEMERRERYDDLANYMAESVPCAGDPNDYMGNDMGMILAGLPDHSSPQGDQRWDAPGPRPL